MEPFDHLNTHAHHVVALFADRYLAEEAVNDVRATGVDEHDFSMLIRHGDELPESDANEEKVRDVATGTALGGALGFVAGALAFGIPGIGTVIGAGLWTSTAIGAALGATAGIELSDFHHAWEGPYRSAVADGQVLVGLSSDDPLVAADVYRIFEKHAPNRLDHFDHNGRVINPS